MLRELGGIPFVLFREGEVVAIISLFEIVSRRADIFHTLSFTCYRCFVDDVPYEAFTLQGAFYPSAAVAGSFIRHRLCSAF